jgi:hypothetical protein
VSILDAAAEEICSILKDAEEAPTPLTARHFARVLYIARRAEEIACAEGRPDEIAVKTRALEALDGKAPRTYAAIKEDLLGGSPVLRAQQAKLEEDKRAVREAAVALEARRQNLQEDLRALTSGAPRILSLSSGESETGGETPGDTETVSEYIPPSFAPEEETPALKRAFSKLPKSHEGDLEHETSAHKRDADRF